MRADRLVSMVLLLRQRGQLTAGELAAELEVSRRTVLRDIEALSGAGIPVYAERGRLGGYALLPGFRTELTALNHDEALALLVAGGGGRAFGLDGALAAALRKIVDALPDANATAAGNAAQRFLVDPAHDLLANPVTTATVPPAVMAPVRAAVLAGRKLRLHYAATGQPPAWRTVDPVGLVTAREHAYLLATVDGADRTFRLDRVHAAAALDEPADRAAEVDLDELWRRRTAAFVAAGEQLTAHVRVATDRRDELVRTALAVRALPAVSDDEWVHVAVTFQDRRHAEWALWQLPAEAEALDPPELRATLAARAAAMATRYANELTVAGSTDQGVLDRR